MDLYVETYSGYKADEYPKRFHLGEQLLEVLDVEDRWYGPGYAYFKVFTDNGKRYILRQDCKNSHWELIL